MIVTVDVRCAAAVDRDHPSARYPCATTLTGAADARTARDGGEPHRAVVEIKRNLGGMIMRALLGGSYLPGGHQARYEVCVDSRPFDSGVAATCDSDLGIALSPGLPADFAHAALSGVMSSAPGLPLPAGALRVDRAAYDLMGSSDSAFQQAGALLRQVLAAMVDGVDVEASVRQALESADG